MSKIEVNTVAPQCGTTLTLGESGDTVVLATGASQTGFGREGSVNWQTTPKTSTFTAANGEGYFINSGSALTMNLPAGSAGAIVAVADYARNFATYNFTISPNGSEKIGGVAADASLNIDGQAATFVYVDSTKGWINVQNAEDTEAGKPPFIEASGGTESTVCTNFKVHTFTGPGTFTVTNSGAPPGSTTVDYLVVAGGGGGGSGGGPCGQSGASGAGGGAGGYRESPGSASGCYSVSPRGAAPAAALPVTETGYPIQVGGGGPTVSPGTTSVSGTDSIFAGSSTITSAGGGGGGTRNPSPSVQSGKAGGSGGGLVADGTIGSGNTPPTNPAQGTDGGDTAGPNNGGGGGGGATGAGGNASPGPSPGGARGGTGGAGGTSSINATPTARAGGGGGGAGGDVPSGHNNPGGTGGSGGGGTGGATGAIGTAGTTNTGGGGGGGGAHPGKNGSAGGSGIVIIRYRFQ